MDQKVIDAVTYIFIETNFANLFSFPGLFKIQAGLFQLKTDKFVKWFNGLGLPIVDNVWINAANMKTDKQEIYGYEHFKEKNYGEFLSRSMAIPAFIDKGFYADGGLYENGVLSQWDGEKFPIFISQLMMPYRHEPKSRIEKLSYAWDTKSFLTFQYQKEFFNNLTVVYPDNGENSSLDFSMDKERKKKMILDAYKITMAQLEYKGVKKNESPVDIALSLSGGGIRSIAHIGVIQALKELNYNPVKWAGTSGGSGVAVLFAAIEKMYKDSKEIKIKGYL